MAKPSPHFARIKQDILAIVITIPKDRLTTYKAIGEYLDIMPRHVAYILSDSLVDIVPWHRVVAEQGQLTKGRRADHQKQLLLQDGFSIDRKGFVAGFESAFILPSQLDTSVPAQTR